MHIRRQGKYEFENISRHLVEYDVIGFRAESKVTCTRVRYVSELRYVSKIKTRYTPSMTYNAKNASCVISAEMFFSSCKFSTQKPGFELPDLSKKIHTECL